MAVRIHMKKDWQRSKEYLDFLDCIRFAAYRRHMMKMVAAYRGSDQRKGESETDLHEIEFVKSGRENLPETACC